MDIDIVLLPTRPINGNVVERCYAIGGIRFGTYGEKTNNTRASFYDVEVSIIDCVSSLPITVCFGEKRMELRNIRGDFWIVPVVE